MEQKHLEFRVDPQRIRERAKERKRNTSKENRSTCENLQIRFKETEQRIQSISRKIQKLEEERDNLLRKQKNRTVHLDSLLGVR